MYYAAGREGESGRGGGSSINLLTCSLPQQASQKKKYCCLYSQCFDRFTSSFQASHINSAPYGKGKKKPKMKLEKKLEKL